MEKIIVLPKTEIGNNLQFSFHHQNESRSILTLSKYPIPFDHFKKGFDFVLSQIKRGNTFLTNLTYPTRIQTSHSLKEIYLNSNAKYKVWLKDKFVVFSPETFVVIENGYIKTCPMKGTIRDTGPNSLQKIINDKKELAEHYTIVDLMRNDLSKVSSNVEVTRWRFPQYINTPKGKLIQISSEITGKLHPGYEKKIGDIIFSLLPAGSISGAPKKETLEIIQHAEKQKRGYYTGICGYFNGQKVDTGVMIRFVEKNNANIFYRSGGGITYKSKASTEYQEMIDKVYFPTKKPYSTLTS